jgi:hypothetical protein
MYSKEIVVAAWDKDYKLWTVDILPNTKITVYNKNINSLQNNEIFLSPNVGRCVHTFLNHIVERYDYLANFTFFAQDYFADHIYNYVQIMNGDKDVWDAFAVIKNNGCWYFNTQYGLLRSDKNGGPHHGGLEIEKIWDMLFKLPLPQDIIFSPAGHFCISKEEARKKPKEFYKKVIDILANDAGAPWVIERLELYIFLDNFLESEIYFANYPDARNQGLDARQHYLQFGINENKQWPNCLDYLKL